MIVNGSTVLLDWVLTANPSYASHIEDFFDIQITDPDGVATYLEGGDTNDNWATLFTQPGDEGGADGQVTYNYTFTKTGVYTIILCTGGAANFTILDTVLALVVDQDTTIPNTVTLS